MKRHPDVCLDYVIDYSERMREAGYYFMDSPGNDLESVAGQVASGSNMIFFVTGNGSIRISPLCNGQNRHDDWALPSLGERYGRKRWRVP